MLVFELLTVFVFTLQERKGLAIEVLKILVKEKVITKDFFDEITKRKTILEALNKNEIHRKAVSEAIPKLKQYDSTLSCQFDAPLSYFF